MKFVKFNLSLIFLLLPSILMQKILQDLFALLSNLFGITCNGIFLPMHLLLYEDHFSIIHYSCVLKNGFIVNNFRRFIPYKRLDLKILIQFNFLVRECLIGEIIG